MYNIFNYSFIDEHLGCFQSGNCEGAKMNTDEQVSLEEDVEYFGYLSNGGVAKS